MLYPLQHVLCKSCNQIHVQQNVGLTRVLSALRQVRHMNRFLVLFFSLLFSALPFLQGLQRDRLDCGSEQDTIPHWEVQCPICAFYRYSDDYYASYDPYRYIEYAYLEKVSSLIPVTGAKCYYLSCQKPAIFWGYWFSYRYVDHFFDYLNYCYKHKNCRCYWPEYSSEAAQISDLAYSLFDNLFTSSPLSKMTDKDYFRGDVFLYFSPSFSSISRHALVVYFIGQQFLFSDYYNVCKDIEIYVERSHHYTAEQVAEIKDRLSEILEALYPHFLDLYTACYKKHPHDEIAQEVQVMKLLSNDENIYAESCSKTKAFPFKRVRKPDQKKYQNKEFYNGDFLLEQGIMLNNLLLHKEAISILTLEITSEEEFYEHGLAFPDVYLERAFAYFETGQIDLALKDYEKAKKKQPFILYLKSILPRDIYIPKDKIAFSKGLISGIKEGVKVSAIEFVPSLYTSLKGMVFGLWAFVCSPSEVSQEVITTAYSIGTFISNHTKMECLECVVPEIRELSISWNTIDDHVKGQKIGYIIGKYGIDIFASIGSLKAINKIRALKRANTMLTLEACATSTESEAVILRESAKRADLRKKLVAATIKKGKIAVKSPNVKYHVMQEKHAWKEVIELSGDVEKDFDKVAALLEENNILSSEFIVRSRKFHEGKVIRTDYKKLINGHEIEATFESYVENKEIFLKDCWVKTRE